MTACRQFVAPFSWTKLDDPPPEPLSFPIGQLIQIVEWTDYCQACDRESRFIADRWCKFGLIAECTGCGAERIAPYTRTGGEG